MGQADVTRSDRVRQVATVAAALAQAGLPALLLPRFAPDPEPPDVMQPAPWAFSIWLPVYGTSLVYAAQQARPGAAADPGLRRIGWPLAAAFAGSGVWAPLVVRGHYWSAQAALFGIAGFAEQSRRRVDAAAAAGRLDPRGRTALVAAVSMLAGWGAAASAVNLAAMLVGKGPVPPGRGVTATGVLSTLAVGGLAAAATGTSAPGSPTAQPYAGTVLWALAGVAAGQRRRSRPVAGAALAAALPVLGAVLRRR